MVLFTLDVDKGDLDRIQNQGFMPKKRVVHSEEKSKSKYVCIIPAFALISTLLSSYLIQYIVNKAIFRASKEEAKQNEEILISRQFYKSTLVMGGAG